MLKKQIPFLLLLIIIFTLMSACTTPIPKVVVPTNFQDTANPIAENLVTGLDKQDYAIFTRDFDEKMLSALPSTAMTEIRKLLWNQNGNFRSLKIMRISEEKGYITVIFNLTFEKGNLDMQLVFSSNPPYKISGLWFPTK